MKQLVRLTITIATIFAGVFIARSGGDLAFAIGASIMFIATAMYLFVGWGDE